MKRRKRTRPTNESLTASQMRFADEHQARAGMEAAGGGGMFFYREDRGWLHRWLVDAVGTVRDEAQFRKHAA